MGKSYDNAVTPQNTPRLKERKMLFLMAMACLEINALLLYHIAYQGRYIAAMIVAAIYTVSQLLDFRKAHWQWWYLTTLIVIAFLLPLIPFLICRIQWHLAVWVLEIIVCGTAFLLMMKRYPKPPKRKRKRM